MEMEINSICNKQCEYIVSSLNKINILFLIIFSVYDLLKFDNYIIFNYALVINLFVIAYVDIYEYAIYDDSLISISVIIIISIFKEFRSFYPSSFVLSILIFTVIYVLSHNSFGLGDVLIAVILSSTLEFNYSYRLFAYTFISAAAFSSFLILEKIANTKDRIALLPFSNLAFIMISILRG